MADHRVGTLVLEGQDSIDFVNSLIRPSFEQREHFRNVFQRIDRTIQISDNDNGNGFTANVDGLDLSFLHVSKERENINVNMIFQINKENNNYLSNTADLEEAVIDVVVDVSYNEHIDSNYLLLAS